MNENKLTLRIEGVPPAFKNSKSIFRNRKTGQPFIATNPKYKKWMNKAIQDLKSQLGYLSHPITAGMAMASYPPALTALCGLSKDFDDSIQWIPDMRVEVRFLHPDYKENERTEIEIELI